MNTFPLGSPITFHEVRGIGTIELNLQPNQRVYTLIGENGIGKTKLLECLFTLMLFTNEKVQRRSKEIGGFYERSNLPSLFTQIGNQDIKIGKSDLNMPFPSFNDSVQTLYNAPLIFIAAQRRGFIQNDRNNISKIGNKAQRLDNYLMNIFSIYVNSPGKFKFIGVNDNINEWIIQRAQSANPYQTAEDNRAVEIDTLIRLLHKIDSKINPAYLKVGGDNSVYLQINNEKRELSELSSGYTSILKILQAIIAGFGNFTNAEELEQIAGYVLIDEIESHLHNAWQVKIIPLLKKLFPNATFIITTHSSIVISQLQEGEAYRLQREEDGVVRTQLITNPRGMTFVDLLRESFGVDINQEKINNTTADSQKEAKEALLTLIQGVSLEGSK
ncbi:AAA family ATPase [uncultured Cardiobacterium sp.]|uniref:AAA family ATPase n=1 Tax=uncultured Cardiobacterium sp. TaxID=417619 RepID=UPI00261E67FC|nr:AAA family ATPase [uncultured Cardiobacterium sp.]